MPDFTSIPLVQENFSLLDQRYVIGDDTELVDKENAKQVKIETLVGELNASITALNAFSTELGVDAVLQARLIGNMTFKTLSGLNAFGEPPNVGTPSEPLAFVYDDEESSGLYIWVATSGAWEQQVPWVKGDKGDKGDAGNTGADGASAFALAQTDGFNGTLSQWIASLKGDQGDQGDPGKTSYQHAVDEGFVGDLTAWLASLKGDKGDKGDGIGTQIDGDTTTLLLEGVTGAPSSISARELQTDPDTGETWIGKTFGSAKIALFDDLMGAAGVSTMSVLEKMAQARWWLAPQDADATWPNRGSGPADAVLTSATFAGSDLDFRQVQLSGNVGGTITEAPFNITPADTWTVAMAVNFDSYGTAGDFPLLFGNRDGTVGPRIFIQKSDSIIYVDFKEGGVFNTTSAGSLPTNEDFIFVLSYDGPNQECFAYKVTASGVSTTEIDITGITDASPPTDDFYIAGVGTFTGELGDFVIDTDTAWSQSEAEASFLAMSMRYRGEESIYRRVFEQGRRGFVQAGDGILETANTYRVKPDETSGGDLQPVNVNANGVSVNAKTMNGFGGGDPVDRTTGSPTFGASDFGGYFEIDTAPTFQKAVMSTEGSGVITIASLSNTNLTCIGSTDVTFQNPNVVIPPYGTIVAKLVATDVYRIIGAIEP